MKTPKDVMRMVLLERLHEYPNHPGQDADRTAMRAHRHRVYRWADDTVEKQIEEGTSLVRNMDTVKGGGNGHA